ncbi:unnamed protein product [Adineta steineri]|uniref:MENTAL domain-containing protein n=1 Tax=Adineta steineri TaxID=433720 RepID=A0A815EIC1_9BILA|nr:unnamed protein product [Adineta steineri]
MIAYAILKWSHWIFVAFATLGSTGFIIAKTCVFTISKSDKGFTDYGILIVSFILAWIEIWFFDYRVIPHERRLREALNHNDRRPLLGSNSSRSTSPIPPTSNYHSINISDERGQSFYSPVPSIEGSDAEETNIQPVRNIRSDSTISQSMLGTPISVIEDYNDDEYGKQADEIIERIWVLTKMLERHAKLIAKDNGNDTDIDECFYAMENAKIVREAEKYYRHMFESGQITWNIRDTHMCDCLQDLLKHYGPGTKAIIWAHNSHVGDARETEKLRAHKINIGQLVRERFGIENTYSIGFTTYTGTVTAADNWDMDPDFKRVRPSLHESIEFLLHNALIKNSNLSDNGQYYLLFRSNNPSIEISKELHSELYKKRLERAIGVIYRPRTERQSHYLNSNISTQFDCVIHIETTRALRPLEIHPSWAEAEKEHVPDTFPMNV